MRTVLSEYRNSILFALSNWRIWLMLYAIQLLFVYLVHLPLLFWLRSILGDSIAMTQLAESFDLNIIMDILHDQGSGIILWLILSLVTTLLFFLFQNLIVGGILKLYKSRNKSIAAFYFSGIRFFVKNIFLSVNYLALLAGILLLGFMFFAKDGLHVLDLDNEVFLIQRFKFLAVCFIALCLFLGIGRDLCRVNIVRHDDKGFFSNMLSALSNILSVKYILLVSLDFVLLAGIIFLYYLCLGSEALQNNSTIMLLVMQLLILSKIILRMTRLGTFYFLSED